MVLLTERRKLGKSSISLPPLGFGCAPIGEIYDRITDDQAAATFQRALELGVRYFDVAPSYGAGLAEMRIGRALRRAADDVGAVHVPRSEVFISTKVCRQLVPDRAVTPNTMNNNDGHGWAGGLNGFNSVMDNTYEGFMKQHNESLHRMGQPYVDGLLMHSQPLPGTEGWEQLTTGGGFRAMEELRDTGAVSAIGTGGGDYQSISAILKHCSLDYVCLPTSYTVRVSAACDLQEHLALLMCSSEHTSTHPCTSIVDRQLAEQTGALL
jgi:D-threo-aldose 1-dehydrogenase